MESAKSQCSQLLAAVAKLQVDQVDVRHERQRAQGFQRKASIDVGMMNWISLPIDADSSLRGVLVKPPLPIINQFARRRSSSRFPS